MGRGVAAPPVDVEFLRVSFTVGSGGDLIRAASARGDLVGEPATYRDHAGVLRVRLNFRGKRRTLTAARLAWIVYFGAYPRGQVRTIGAADDFRRGNLALVPHCRHRPWTKGGGQASALERRAAVDRALLSAMAEHESAGLADLARLVGIAEGRISTKLNRLASRGLAESPMCVPGRSWVLSPAGRELAELGRPLLDALDREILQTLALAPMGHVWLSRRIGVCLLTAKRRLGLLVGRGLVTADIRKFYSVTPAGLEALGPDAPAGPRWVRPDLISAAAAPDVQRRLEHPNELSKVEKSRYSSLAAKKGRANAKRGLTVPFNPWFEMAG